MTPEEIAETRQRRSYLDNCRKLLGWVDYRRDDAYHAYLNGVRRSDYIASVAEREHVGAALKPLRGAAVYRTWKGADAVIDKVFTGLADHDWDIEKAAPFPVFTDKRRRSKRGRYDLFHLLTEPDPDRGAHYVRADPAAMLSLIQEARVIAERCFDDFLLERVVTLGPDVSNANLTADYEACTGTLCVVRTGGVIEYWSIRLNTVYSLLGSPKMEWTCARIRT